MNDDPHAAIPTPSCSDDATPRRTPRRVFRVLVLTTGAGLLVAIVLFVGSNLFVMWQGGRHRVAGPGEAPNAEVAIVLGAKVWTGGTPSNMLQDRLLTAIELYRQGKVGKLLLSGDHGRAGYDEVNAMRTFVLDRGVPPENVFMDHAGFSTYDTMYRARDVFQVREAIVVTQGFHLDRAVYTARALGLEATGVPADLRPYQNAGRFAARDWLARGKALLQLHVLHARPRFLGPPIPIGGDGRVTAG
ncbi:MAG: YdcF family protein [Thermoleophilia bacterium]|nr:YdcF family protein [Thermoleophilia bacterium]